MKSVTTRPFLRFWGPRDGALSVLHVLIMELVVNELNSIWKKAFVAPVVVM
jgi:hypothetical protein